MKFSYPSGAKPLQGYTIKRGIGIGGFGEVYFALNDAGKEVALKKIQRNLDIELRGVRQCLNIRHVNLISLWDIRTNSTHESWVVMEYVPGPSLRDILDDHPRGIPESMLKLWFTSIASGVAYLHHRGIVHRDLKPANVFRDDDAHVIKIGDYGLSKFISSSHESGQTGTVGTVHYMAPEISKGIYGKEIDIYALGIILFELLTGDVPFNGETSQEIMYKHLLEEINFETCSPEYRKVLEGCLSKKPESRFSNVSELMAAMPWPEFAGKDKKILSLHSVGVFPKPDNVPTASATAAEKDSNGSGARIEPILISNQNESAHIPAIFFGPVSDYPMEEDLRRRNDINLRQLRKTTPPRESQPNEPATEKKPAAKKFAKRTTVVGMDPVALMGPDEVETALDEMKSGAAPIIREQKGKGKLRLSQRRRIFAKKVARKCHNISDRLSNHFLATPIRVGSMLLAAIVIIVWPRCLPWGAAILASAWISWLLMRSWAGQSEIEHRERRLRKTGVQPHLIQQWLDQRPAADRFTESLGATIVGFLCCITLSFLGLSVWYPPTSADIEGWAFYSWLALTCSFATILMLCCVRLFNESQTFQIPVQRLLMAGAGFATSVISLMAAKYFLIDLTFAELAQAGPQHFLRIAVSTTAAWIIFHVAFFGLVHWSKLTDPLRLARIRIWDVCVAVVCAAAISQLLGLQLMNCCIIASVIAVSVQLSAPWLSHQQREQVCFGTRDSKVS